MSLQSQSESAITSKDFTKVEQRSGWCGAKVTSPPKVPPGLLFTTEIFENCFIEIFENLKMIMPLMQPPFIKMESPSGSPLGIELNCHWHLLCSLILSEETTPTSKFKVTQVKNKRTMAVSLAEDGTLSLKRDDQENMPYKIDWFNSEKQREWIAVRTYFLEKLQLNQGRAKAVQLGMLQMLLAVSELPSEEPDLKAQVQQYCYGTNAWMYVDKQDGHVLWRMASTSEGNDAKDLSKEASTLTLNKLSKQASKESLFESIGANPKYRTRWYNGEAICTPDDQFEEGTPDDLEIDLATSDPTLGKRLGEQEKTPIISDYSTMAGLPFLSRMSMAGTDSLTDGDGDALASACPLDDLEVASPSASTDLEITWTPGMSDDLATVEAICRPKLAKESVKKPPRVCWASMHDDPETPTSATPSSVQTLDFGSIPNIGMFRPPVKNTFINFDVPRLQMRQLRREQSCPGRVQTEA